MVLHLTLLFLIFRVVVCEHVRRTRLGSSYMPRSPGWCPGWVFNAAWRRWENRPRLYRMASAVLTLLNLILLNSIQLEFCSIECRKKISHIWRKVYSFEKSAVLCLFLVQASWGLEPLKPDIIGREICWLTWLRELDPPSDFSTQVFVLLSLATQTINMKNKIAELEVPYVNA